MSKMSAYHIREHGFTLIELMVSMAIGVILLAGISMMFISDGDMATAQSSRSERYNDLYLASQIMQGELRESQAICWDSANNRIIYQPLDSTSSLGSCNSVATDASNNFLNGAFAFSGGAVCWDKPGWSSHTGCQEVVRNMASTPQGLQVSPTSNTDMTVIRTVTLTSLYQNSQKQSQTVDLSFHVWPRN